MKHCNIKLGFVTGLFGIAAAAVAAPAPADKITDIRVAPLLQTKWSQSDSAGASGTSDKLICYNYYTPNNSACGCTATAAAQIMLHHRHPAAAVTPETYPCYVFDTAVGDYVEESLRMMGGVYAWDLMSLDPMADKECPAIRRQAIGRLTYDIAVACQTAFFDSTGSSSASALLLKRLVDRFQYANAIGVSFGADLYAAGEFNYTPERFKAAVIPNLDAGLPVMLSVSSAKSGGHVVACDGYGYADDGQFYIHVNMGWSGSGDGWYMPPNFIPANDDRIVFDTIDAVYYNIYPTQTAGASIVSGRVLDWYGRPAKDVTVTASSASAEIAKVTTNDKGVYALIVPAGTYEIRAVRQGQWGAAEVAVESCVSTAYPDVGGVMPNPMPQIGNVFDFNLTMNQGEMPDPEEDQPDDPSEIIPEQELGADVKEMFREHVGAAAKDLPSGVKWDKKTGMLSGKPKKPGVYTITFTQGKEKTYETMTVQNYVDPLIPIADAYGPGSVGVIVPEDLFAVAADCKVSGLPNGLKFRNGRISGVPTKAGTYTVIFTKKVGTQTHKASATFVIEALPEWAQGTFDGGSDYGQLSFTISKAGKLSGSWISVNGKEKITYSAFDGFANGAYVFGGLAINEQGMKSLEPNVPFEAYRNMWKTDRKNEAKQLKGKVPQPQEVEGGSLSFKVGANGTVKVTGVFGGYKASCSATLIPTDVDGTYNIFVAFPEKYGKFVGFAKKLQLVLK